MTAIVLGLNHPFVRQLTDIWSRISDRGWILLESLEKLCLDVNGHSWKLFEEMEASLHKREQIIPFWGIYLLKTKFAAQASRGIGDLVYFDRYRRLAQATRRVMAFSKKFKRAPAPAFARIDAIRDRFLPRKSRVTQEWWTEMQTRSKALGRSV